jgi:hypothetical protein
MKLIYCIFNYVNKKIKGGSAMIRLLKLRYYILAFAGIVSQFIANLLNPQKSWDSSASKVLIF